MKEGDRVVLAKRPNADAGTVRQLVEPTPGRHRALVLWDSDRMEQFVDVDKLAPTDRDAPPPVPTIEQLCDELGIETVDLETLRRERDQVASLIVAEKLQRNELEETENVQRWIELDAILTAGAGT